MVQANYSNLRKPSRPVRHNLGYEYVQGQLREELFELERTRDSSMTIKGVLAHAALSGLGREDDRPDVKDSGQAIINRSITCACLASNAGQYTWYFKDSVIESYYV